MATSLFADIHDRHLLKLGVPEELLPLVKTIRNEAQLDRAVQHLPDEAHEALLALAAGYTLNEVLREYDRELAEAPAVDTEDFQQALQNPDSKRRFVVVDDDQALKEVLGKKWNDHYGVPKATVWLTGILQIVGGLALLVGLLTSLTAAILTLDMLAALFICIFNSHHREPFNSVSPEKGWDVNLLLVASLIAVILLTGGAWSLDALLGLSPWLI